MGGEGSVILAVLVLGALIGLIIYLVFSANRQQRLYLELFERQSAIIQNLTKAVQDLREVIVHSNTTAATHEQLLEQILRKVDK